VEEGQEGIGSYKVNTRTEKRDTMNRGKEMQGTEKKGEVRKRKQRKGLCPCPAYSFATLL
jgi:hypothetical protein